MVRMVRMVRMENLYLPVLFGNPLRKESLSTSNFTGTLRKDRKDICKGALLE